MDVTATFKSHPKTFLRGKPTLLRGFEGYSWSEKTGSTGSLWWKKSVMTSRTPFNVAPSANAHGDIHHYMPSQHTGFDDVDFAVDDKGPIAEIVIRRGGAKTEGVIYLPFKEDTTTHLTLSTTSRWFFTGPLEGCHVYVATGGGPPVVIHANANATGGLSNAAVKNSQSQHVAAGLPGYIITKTLVADDYKPGNGDPYRAFVFGINASAGWRFYCHSINLKTFATIRATHWT